MWSQSVWSSTITAQAAALFLKEGGLVTLTGAQPALKGTAGGHGLALTGYVVPIDLPYLHSNRQTGSRLPVGAIMLHISFIQMNMHYTETDVH